MIFLKNILITGAGSGLGKMAAIRLAKRGHHVYATTHYENEANTLNEYAKKNNINLESFKLDILLEEDRLKTLKYDIDVLINNAAIGDSGSISEINVDRIENVFETNVFSNIKLTQLVLKNMIKKGNGRVIFLSSLAGKISIPFLAPYASSKFAIEGFVEALRMELKLLKSSKIDIILIEPGAYATGFNKENNDKKYTWMYEESYFKNRLPQLQEKETKIWNFIESKNFNRIVSKYVKAVESKHPKFRYTAPFSQSVLTQIGRIFGM